MPAPTEPVASAPEPLPEPITPPARRPATPGCRPPTAWRPSRPPAEGRVDRTGAAAGRNAFTSAADPTQPPISLNTADAQQLRRLQGVGRERAARIVAYREANGPFADLRDLTRVEGFGQQRVTRLIGRVTL
jgi:competence protein ComEA